MENPPMDIFAIVGVAGAGIGLFFGQRSLVLARDKYKGHPDAFRKWWLRYMGLNLVLAIALIGGSLLLLRD
jgi:hypothetical protein